MPTSTNAKTKAEPATVIVSDATALVISNYGKAEKAQGDAFRKICRHVHDNNVSVAELKQGFMNLYDNDQMARNETSKVNKICAVDEVYKAFAKGAISAKEAKDKVTEWSVDWDKTKDATQRTWEDNLGIRHDKEGGNSKDPLVTVGNRLLAVAKYAINKADLQEGTFLQEAEEQYRNAVSGRKKKKTDPDDDNGEDEDQPEGVLEEGELEEEDNNESEEETKITPRSLRKLGTH
jgi:hypothetical protein